MKKCKERHIWDIYSSAKKEWKRNKKQEVIEFYIKEEVIRELEKRPGRFYELKAYCNHFADSGEIQVLIGMISVLIGCVSNFEQVSLIVFVLLMSIEAIILPIPHKKCKFVLDNLE